MPATPEVAVLNLVLVDGKQADRTNQYHPWSEEPK
jgi:hypothetical protein